jgi:TRAP-type C4-dicarboxylate transport system permease small subunit
VTPADLNAAAPPLLRGLLNGLDRLSRLDGWLGGICLTLLTLLMLTEVALRLLSGPFPFVPPTLTIAWEWSSYLMAATFTFGAAMTLRGGGHIRVSLLLAHVPHAMRRLLEFGSALVGFAFTLLLTWSMALFAFQAYSRGQTSISSDTPLWIPQAAITVGIALLAAQFLARTIQAALGLPLEDPRLKASAAAE